MKSCPYCGERLHGIDETCVHCGMKLNLDKSPDLLFRNEQNPGITRTSQVTDDQVSSWKMALPIAFVITTLFYLVAGTKWLTGLNSTFLVLVVMGVFFVLTILSSWLIVMARGVIDRMIW